MCHSNEQEKDTWQHHQNKTSEKHFCRYLLNDYRNYTKKWTVSVFAMVLLLLLGLPPPSAANPDDMKFLQATVMSHTQSLENMERYLIQTDNFWKWYQQNHRAIDELLSQQPIARNAAGVLPQGDNGGASSDSSLLQLQNKVADLENEYKKKFESQERELESLKRFCSAERQQREEMYDDLHGKIELHNQVMEEYKGITEKLEEQVGPLIEQVNVLNQTVIRQQNNMKGLVRKNNRSSETKFRQAQRERTNLKDQMEKATGDIGVMWTEISDFRQNVERYKENITNSLEGMVFQTMFSLMDDVERHSNQINQSRDIIENSVLQRLTTVEGRLNSLSSGNANPQSSGVENQGVQRQINNLHTQLGKVGGDIARIDGDIARIDGNISRIEEKVSGDQVQSLSTNVGSLQRRVGELERKLVSHEKTVNSKFSELDRKINQGNSAGNIVRNSNIWQPSVNYPQNDPSAPASSGNPVRPSYSNYHGNSYNPTGPPVSRAYHNLSPEEIVYDLPGTSGIPGNGNPGTSSVPGPQSRQGRPEVAGDYDVRRPRGPPGSRGLQGVTGNYGERGEPGSPGAPGLPGERGAAGDYGYPGYYGSPGAPGAPGAPGLPGNYGGRGEPGAPGGPGLPGERGATGNYGYTGYYGSPGEPGAPGLPGDYGERGEPGAPGGRGLPGERGAPGDYGYPGYYGTPGAPGAPGAPGLTGDYGEGGEPGAPGAPGRPGDRGATGNYGYTGYYGSPGEPGAPGLPGDYGERGAPGGPGGPGAPGGPGGPGAPGLPGERGGPGDYGYPGYYSSTTRAPGDYYDYPGYYNYPDYYGYPGLAGRPGETGQRGAPGRPGPPGPAG